MIVEFLDALHRLLYRKHIRAREAKWPGCPVHAGAKVVRVFPTGKESYPMCTKCLAEAAAAARRQAGRG